MTGFPSDVLDPSMQKTILDWADNQDDTDAEIAQLTPRTVSTTNEKLFRAIFLPLFAGTFATSLYFSTQEVKNVETSRRLYTVCMWATGVSFAFFYHILFPHKFRKLTYKIMNAGSYETFYILTNGYLNAPNPYIPVSGYMPRDLIKLKKILHGGFAAIAGAFQGRDLASLISAELSEHVQTLKIPKEKDLIPMLSISTRNRNAKWFFLSELIVSVALTALFFKFEDQNFGDLHKRGLYGNLIGFFTGSSIGYFSTKILDDLKEGDESQHSQPAAKLPCYLKTLRVLKSGFMTSVPLSFAFLLQFLNAPWRHKTDKDPNGLADYISMVAIGIIYGAIYFLTRRERENSQSSYYQIKKREEIDDNALISGQVSCCERIWTTTKETLFTFGCYVALNAYMITIGVKSGDESVIAAITALLVTLLVSGIFTGSLVSYYSPKKNEDLQSSSLVKRVSARIANEVYFRVTTPTLLAFSYQYLRNKFDIGDQDMENYSKELLGAAIFTWVIWAITWVSLRVLFMRNQQRSLYTPALAGTEMMITVANGFRS